MVSGGQKYLRRNENEAIELARSMYGGNERFRVFVDAAYAELQRQERVEHVTDALDLFGARNLSSGTVMGVSLLTEFMGFAGVAGGKSN